MEIVFTNLLALWHLEKKMKKTFFFFFSVMEYNVFLATSANGSASEYYIN